jgi:hypothetical protein
MKYIFKVNYGCGDTHLSYEEALSYLKQCEITRPQLKLKLLRQQKIRFIPLSIGDFFGHLRNIDD